MSDESRDQNEGTSSADSGNAELLVRGLVEKLVAEIAPPESPRIRPDHALREELGFDSVREVELTFALEELFEFEPFVVEDAPQLVTVGDLADFTLDMIVQGRAAVPTPDEAGAMGRPVPASVRRPE